MTDPSNRRGIEFAWRTHSAITDWTAKVDSKASIVLSLGGVLLGFVVTLSTNGRLLTGLHGRAIQLQRVGLCLIVVGVGLSALVVAPRLKRRSTRKDWRKNFIYFGHLRHWQPPDLLRRLKSLTEDEELEVLATQLIDTSRIAWFKHSCLQWAIGFLAAGVLMLAGAVLL